ncbi:hypothetical protein [Pantoea agglomerans]|uniref:hypothetical protein n=1 Tax=Enterobacter agglomerans TaxID=549 RepID=UPI002413CA6B|nr:hypothetical protein [Pantoea agglomerans]
MTIPQAVKDWHERSERVADAIEEHLNHYPDLNKSAMVGKHVIIQLGTRYTVITGFVAPEVISKMFEPEKSSDIGQPI